MFDVLLSALSTDLPFWCSQGEKVQIFELAWTRKHWTINSQIFCFCLFNIFLCTRKILKVVCALLFFKILSSFQFWVKVVASTNHLLPLISSKLISKGVVSAYHAHCDIWPIAYFSLSHHRILSSLSRHSIPSRWVATGVCRIL